MALWSGQADGLILNYARGFRERSLDFVEAWPLRRITILARTLRDLDPIYRLAPTLCELSLTASDRAEVDLALLPELRALGGDWALMRNAVAALGELQELRVLDFDDYDLTVLSENTALKRLTLKAPRRLARLTGVESLPLLEFVWLAGAPGLTDLADLASCKDTLTELRLDTCGRITTVDDLAQLVNLTTLRVANCGPIASLAPLVGLTRLEKLYLYESTRVMDGDLSPLLQLTRLTDLRMMNRRHYEPTVANVRIRLGLDS